MLLRVHVDVVAGEVGEDVVDRSASAVAQPSDVPLAPGAVNGTTTLPFVPAAPLWMCAAAAGSVTFAAVSRKQTRPSLGRNRRTTEPVAFGSLVPFNVLVTILPTSVELPLSCPRIAPAGNSAVWMFT